MIFDYFAPFIQDWIYARGWERLRDVQEEAGRVLFETENNLLITSGTASGKTEAAFFPIISMMCADPPKSVGCVYVAPLKSLINDQFSRLDELLDMSGIPVFHWHGDVAMSHKNKALKEPSGILQITPESLESMLMNRSNDIVRIFGDLRFVVIDELHILTGTDRGAQIICQLNRIGHIIGRHPRRIGLSATVGDVRLAADWLGAGSGRETESPVLPEKKLTWRLGLEHFYIQNPNAKQSNDAPGYPAYDGEGFDNDALTDDESAKPADDESAKPADDESAGAIADGGTVYHADELAEVRDGGSAELDPGYEYIYDCSKGKKCLVFSNSREETEYITATLRQIAERRGEPDIFSIHHGNLSAALREEAELKLKNDDDMSVTCATVTLELGIDIGRLQRVLQLDSPSTVSSFLQRLGRSGRRGEPPEMIMVFREESPLPNTPLPQLIPWGLLRAIAIIQLYAEERFIEPPSIKTHPFSLMFQQTLSVLAASGELTPKRLAEKVMTLPPFRFVSKEDYKVLMLSMIKNDFLEMTDEGGLIVGMKGERLINSFKFYAVFKDTEDYTVRCESDEIGTITTPPPVGDRFALAGRVWEVEELDIARKLIYVHHVKGKMEISWPGDYGEIHTKILERMRQILAEDTVYPYLKPNAAHRIEVVRALARNTGILDCPIVPLGGYSWCFFPWLGTRSFRTLRKFIAMNGREFKLSNLEYEGCCYMTFRMENGDGRDFIHHLREVSDSEGIDVNKLATGDFPVFDKYDDFIPNDLRRKAYAADRLRSDEAEKRLRELDDMG